MRYGIISDIHGNSEALLTAIDALSRERIDEYLCVGDIVGYGAEPAKCIKKTKALTSHIICGNHDVASVGLMDIKHFTNEAQAAIIWTQANLSRKNVDFLKGLGFVHKNEHLTMVHGSLEEPEAFHYIFDRNAAYETFRLMDTSMCFIGHSHVPGIFSCKNGKIEFFYKEKFKLPAKGKTIINAGSVGQPRDGDPRLCYVVYDTEKKLVEFKRLSYDIEKAQKKIMDAGLPSFFAYRLSEGR